MFKIFAHYFPSHTLQQALLDAVLLFLTTLFAVAFQLEPVPLDWQLVIPGALFFALLMVGLNSVTGLYRIGQKTALGRFLWVPIAFSLLISLPVAWMVFQLFFWDTVLTESLQLVILLLLSTILVMRGIVNQHSASVAFAPRVLVIGAGADALAVEQALSNGLHAGTHIVGFFSPPDEGGHHQVDPNRILKGGNLFDIVRQQQVSQIIVAVKERRGGAVPINELLDCKLLGIKIFDLSSFFERTEGKLRLESLKASWLIYGDGFRQGACRSFVKRVFDIVVALLLLLLAWPLMLLTMAAILFEDGGPIFYRQERVGLGGRIFRVVKFRSMRTDAEKDGKPRWASSSDDRVTRVGRLIRKARIDELPQLFNVLSGEMSLVGPRPERPFFVDQLAHKIPFYTLRHGVKPGVTGWAQVRYQYGASVDDAMHKLQYDLYYVKNHTLMLDTLVLFETIRVVLTGEGAH